MEEKEAWGKKNGGKKKEGDKVVLDKVSCGHVHVLIAGMSCMGSRGSVVIRKYSFSRFRSKLMRMQTKRCFRLCDACLAENKKGRKKELLIFNS